jgi:hypothetical protein
VREPHELQLSVIPNAHFKLLPLSLKHEWGPPLGDGDAAAVGLDPSKDTIGESSLGLL